MHKRNSDRLIAAIATAILAAIILLTLFFTGLSWDKEVLALNSIPEVAPEEEVFLEPELLEEPGEEIEEKQEELEAAADRGEPDPAPELNRVKEVAGENPEPAPKVEKQVTTTKPSPVKATEPPKTDKEPKRATDPLAGKFSSRNGSKDGRINGNGAAKTGTAQTQGSVRGRKFKGAAALTAEVNQKIVVRVSVTVDAEGRVKAASISDGGAADSKLRNKILANAKTARWEAKPGAPDASGILTYTITPKL
ncbi:MAG: hypothetical protein HDS73_05865 [Bacteroidales bacterium]|nr:hypothetical protein [Bacteroidales bacterium]